MLFPKALDRQQLYLQIPGPKGLYFVLINLEKGGYNGLPFFIYEVLEEGLKKALTSLD